MADTHDTLCAELDSMKIVHITRVRGGTRSDRERKAKEIRGDRFYCFAIEHDVSETAVWRFEDPGGPVKLPWKEICRLTTLGNSLCPDRACIIDLDRFEPRFTTYEVTPEKLTINVLPAAAVADPITAGKRDGSLRWILESHARPLCVVNWPKGGDIDANNLPHLPATVKQLELRGMSNFLRDRVPTKYECGPDHWIHNFVAKFKDLKTLTLTDCHYRLEDVAILEVWIPQLSIVKRGGVWSSASVHNPASNDPHLVHNRIQDGVDDFHVFRKPKRHNSCVCL